MLRLALASLLLPFAASAQPTVGLLRHTAGSTDDGYVLMAPIASTNTYLLDKCGKEVHRWSSAYKAGQAAYLLPDGSLLRAGAPVNATFNAGGRGGVVEKLDWNGSVSWAYPISGTTQCQHHDIKALPNGNVLALVWELKTAVDAVAAGRGASLIGATTWSEKVVELRPVGTNQATIVWEWHAWDHLVQSVDATKANYAPVAQHPELVNVNYNTTAAQPDWLHFNAIDYNPALDQILISSHGLNEVWVLDHSTTTAQAASHSGGRQGHGGDLLYRWGNPAAYSQGSTADRKLFGQHNAYWLETGLPYAGSIQLFNNGLGRPGGNASSVDVLTPPVNAAGQYAASLPYGPAALTATYAPVAPDNFFAMNISGAQRLPNGNLLVCNGPAGRFFEVTSTGAKVWEYLNPVGNAGPVAQGATATMNTVFRAPFYASTYGAFAGRSLSAGPPIELNPMAYSCSLLLAAQPAAAVAPRLSLYPNPAETALTIDTSWPSYDVLVTNSAGQVLLRGANVRRLATQSWPAGLYVLTLRDAAGVVQRQKFSIGR